MKNKLILCIGLSMYDLVRIHPEQGVTDIAWNLTKIPNGPTYTVSAGKFGTSCDCGDHVWRKRDSGELCKHVAACIEKGLI